MIKVGLIGLGFMGSTHSACYELLQKQDSVKVTAVADLDEEKAKNIAEKFGAKVYKNGYDLIENAGIDAVDICLPTYLHADHAIKAMEKGYNVFVEKPVCLNESEADKLMAVKKKTGVEVMVGHCIRFWDEYSYLKNVVDDKIYGNIKSAVFKRISPRPEWAWEGWILDNNRSGSAALDLHIHDVDYVRYILGNPDGISSTLSYTEGNPEHAFSIYKYGDIVVTIEGGWDYPNSFPFEMEYRVKFEKATILFNTKSSPSLVVYLNNGEQIIPELNKKLEESNENLGGNISSLGGYYNELKYFTDCLNNKQTITAASLEEAVKSLKLILQEIKVADTN